MSPDRLLELLLLGWVLVWDSGADSAALVPLRWCRCASVDYEVYSTMDSGKILEWILGGFWGLILCRFWDGFWGGF